LFRIFLKKARSGEDIPIDFQPSPIGPRALIIEKIKEAAPSADFSDASWGRIADDSWSVEVNLGKQEDCKHFAFHIRGGDGAVGVVAAILQHLGLRAVDSQTGDFFEPGPKALESFRNWRAYRDRIVGGSNRAASDL
jgi:hypothetical protein